jgi:hypothetical protein
MLKVSSIGANSARFVVKTSRTAMVLNWSRLMKKF